MPDTNERHIKSSYVQIFYDTSNCAQFGRDLWSPHFLEPFVFGNKKLGEWTQRSKVEERQIEREREEN